jgi:hypothetical protein
MEESLKCNFKHLFNKLLKHCNINEKDLKQLRKNKINILYIFYDLN